jgi:hypothetical protein
MGERRKQGFEDFDWGLGFVISNSAIVIGKNGVGSILPGI